MIKKHSVELSGHSTSIALEDEFWVQIKQIAQQKGLSLRQLLIHIDNTRTTNLASAIRVFVLNEQIKQNTNSQSDTINRKN